MKMDRKAKPRPKRMDRGARLQRKTQELTEQAVDMTLVERWPDGVIELTTQRCWKTPGSKSKGRKSIFQATSGGGEWLFLMQMRFLRESSGKNSDLL